MIEISNHQLRTFLSLGEQLLNWNLPLAHLHTGILGVFDGGYIVYDPRDHQPYSVPIQSMHRALFSRYGKKIQDSGFADYLRTLGSPKIEALDSASWNISTGKNGRARHLRMEVCSYGRGFSVELSLVEMNQGEQNG